MPGGVPQIINLRLRDDAIEGWILDRLLNKSRKDIARVNWQVLNDLGWADFKD